MQMSPCLLPQSRRFRRILSALCRLAAALHITYMRLLHGASLGLVVSVRCRFVAALSFLFFRLMKQKGQLKERAE